MFLHTFDGVPSARGWATAALWGLSPTEDIIVLVYHNHCLGSAVQDP